MAAPKGKSKPQYSHDEKRAIVEQVANLYASQQSTLASCCEAAGISYGAFYLWITENEEFKEIYKKGREKNEEIFWDKLRPIANSAMKRLLEGEYWQEETEADAVFKGMPTGEKITTVKRGKVLPNATVTIFAQKGLNPDKFAERQKVETENKTEIQVSITDHLTLDEQRAILKAIKAQKKADNGASANESGNVKTNP